MGFLGARHKHLHRHFIHMNDRLLKHYFAQRIDLGPSISFLLEFPDLRQAERAGQESRRREGCQPERSETKPWSNRWRLHKSLN